jgi:predicted Zn finger-like uncharacterized protein
MHIICPHCTTSYAINPATLGVAGRTVRCSRCKEVWLARLEDAALAEVLIPAGGDHRVPDSAVAPATAHGSYTEQETPMVESPSISAEWPTGGDDAQGRTDRPSPARQNAAQAGTVRPRRPSLLRRLKPALSFGPPTVSLTTACAAMGALLLALVIWRADVVRLLPQTAAFY